jgi:hypothetical protein
MRAAAIICKKKQVELSVSDRRHEIRKLGAERRFDGAPRSKLDDASASHRDVERRELISKDVTFDALFLLCSRATVLRTLGVYSRSGHTHQFYSINLRARQIRSIRNKVARESLLTACA